MWCQLSTRATVYSFIDTLSASPDNHYRFNALTNIVVIPWKWSTLHNTEGPFSYQNMLSINQKYQIPIANKKEQLVILVLMSILSIIMIQLQFIDLRYLKRKAWQLKLEVSWTFLSKCHCHHPIAVFLCYHAFNSQVPHKEQNIWQYPTFSFTLILYPISIFYTYFIRFIRYNQNLQSRHLYIWQILHLTNVNTFCSTDYCQAGAPYCCWGG